MVCFYSDVRSKELAISRHCVAGVLVASSRYWCHHSVVAMSRSAMTVFVELSGSAASAGTGTTCDTGPGAS